VVRWTWLTGLAIFIFFAASGSRRSYYILPLVPALALITGKVMSDWLARPSTPGSERIVKSAALATAAIPVLAGIALVFAYFTRDLPHHAAQIVAGALAIIGSGAAFVMFLRNRKAYGAILLFVAVFVAEIWAFTGGMSSMEEMRTFRPFCREAAQVLQGTEDNKIALFPGGDSSLVFYLGRGPLKTLTNPAQVADFFKEYPDGALIAELKSTEDLRAKPGFEETRIVLLQAKEPREKKNDRLALVRLREK
jgi:hypothetical protein